jgi:hypothetical protein
VNRSVSAAEARQLSGTLWALMGHLAQVELGLALETLPAEGTALSLADCWVTSLSNSLSVVSTDHRRPCPARSGTRL